LNFELIVGVAINEATVDLIFLADFFFFSMIRISKGYVNGCLKAFVSK